VRSGYVKTSPDRERVVGGVWEYGIMIDSSGEG